MESTASTHNYLVVGATSGIARALIDRLAANSVRFGRSAGFVLAARNTQELDRLAADVTTRHGCPVVTRFFDATSQTTTNSLIPDCVAALPGGLSDVILCHGWLPDVEQARNDPSVQRKLIEINYTSFVVLLEQAAKYFEEQSVAQRGSDFPRPLAITAISSIAGERGRQSNYPYGATKAALTAYLSGLRSRLHRAGVAVLTVKPGYVDTAMTRGRVDPNSRLNADPARVAHEIAEAMRNRTDVLYTPRYWRWVGAGMRAMPERVFKRLKV